MKVCSKCGKELNESCFDKRKSSKDGLYGQCKECRKKYNDAYRKNNKDKIDTQRKEYRCKNKELLSERSKKYRKENPEKMHERYKRSYAKHKEYNIQYQRKYRAENKEKIKLAEHKSYEKNKEKKLEKSMQYQKEHREEISQKAKQYAIDNRDALSAQRRNYYHSIALYDRYADKLTIEEQPELAEDGKSLTVLCRYCGRRFSPTVGAVTHRIAGLRGTTTGENCLYDTEDCKLACPIFKKIRHIGTFKKASSREVPAILRQIVLKRDNYTCVYCGATTADTQIHCHHIQPAVSEPMFQADPENCISVCVD